VRYRPFFWWLTFALLVVAAVLAYSPNPHLRRHIVPLSLLGAALFSAGWAVGGAALVGDT
jgi:cell shape-determining protein MreD